jgi:hypothetical protein
MERTPLSIRILKVSEPADESASADVRCQGSGLYARVVQLSEMSEIPMRDKHGLRKRARRMVGMWTVM